MSSLEQIVFAVIVVLWMLLVGTLTLGVVYVVLDLLDIRRSRDE